MPAPLPPHEDPESSQPAPRSRSLPIHRPGPSRLTAGANTVLGVTVGAIAGVLLLAGPGLILGILVGMGFGVLRDNPRG